MKNAVIIILCCIIVGLGGFVVYDKVINRGEKKDNNAVTVKDDEVDVKAQDVLDETECNCPQVSDGQVICPKTQCDCDKKVLLEFGFRNSLYSDYTVNGIEGTAIGIVRTYSCSGDFELGVLTEDGSVYVYNSNKNNFNTDTTKELNFKKIDSSVKFYSIRTMSTSEIQENYTKTNYMISCAGSAIIVYDKDWNIYEVGYRASTQKYYYEKIGKLSF